MTYFDSVEPWLAKWPSEVLNCKSESCENKSGYDSRRFYLGGNLHGLMLHQGVFHCFKFFLQRRQPRTFSFLRASLQLSKSAASRPTGGFILQVLNHSSSMLSSFLPYSIFWEIPLGNVVTQAAFTTRWFPELWLPQLGFILVCSTLES